MNIVIFPYIFGKVKEYVEDDVGKDAFFDCKNICLTNLPTNPIIIKNFRNDARFYKRNTKYACKSCKRCQSNEIRTKRKKATISRRKSIGKEKKARGKRKT